MTNRHAAHNHREIHITQPTKLNELLAQCDAEITLDECDQVWLNAPAVGLEIIDDEQPMT